MGGHYGSVHLRTSDRDSVHQAVQAIAAKRKRRCLIGPPLKGWVAVYPDNHGDAEFCQAVAESVLGDALHVYVFDDDIFGYRFYRDGTLIDEYNSEPNYFEEQPPEEKARLRGRPEVFAEYVPRERDRRSLQELLSPEYAETVVFASETLERFARLLGLPNAVAAYEYLEDGETENITGWDRFVHVPDRAEERSRKAKIQDALNAEKQRLTNAGFLLTSRTGLLKPLVNSRLEFFTMPLICADHKPPGFLACWAEASGSEFHHIERWAPPWDQAPIPLELTIQDSVHALALSPSGRYLGVGHAYGNWKAQLFDFEKQSLLADIPHDRSAAWVGFDWHEKFLVSTGENEVIITSVTGAPVRSIHIPGVDKPAIHPSGVLIVPTHDGVLLFVELPSGRVIKSLKFVVDASHRPEPLYEGVSTDPNFLAAMEQAKSALEEQFKEQGLDENESRLKAEEEIGQAREMAAGRLAMPEHVFALATSSDGKLFFAGTNDGVRVFAWDDVVRAKENVPPPLFAVPQKGASRRGPVPGTGGYVYALAHDEPGHRLVYAGLDGVVSALDLETGMNSVVLSVPAKPAIIRLSLSKDARTFCCVCGLNSGNPRTGTPPELQVWDYIALRGQFANG